MTEPSRPTDRPLRCLGLQTDIDVLGDRAELVELAAGRARAVRAPSMPRYHWGNFLVYQRAPEPGDLAQREADFDAAFADLPEVQHCTFAWDDPVGPDGAIAQFTDVGYEYEPGLVLTTREPAVPPRFDGSLDVRLVETDVDWDAVRVGSVACRDGEGDSEADDSAFLRSREAHRRELVARGTLRWLAAWVDGHVAGNLGIHVVDGRGRFQAVETHPEFRRRGICATLVHADARMAIDELDARDLVIVAIDGEPAARIYESVGFVPTERWAGLRLADARSRPVEPAQFTG